MDVLHYLKPAYLAKAYLLVSASLLQRSVMGEETARMSVECKVSYFLRRYPNGIIHYLSLNTLCYLGESNTAFPLLDVPDPEDQAWDFLEHFGVLVKVKANDLVNRLEYLKHTNFTTPNVSELYRQIQSCLSEEDLGFIRCALVVNAVLNLEAIFLTNFQG